MKALQARSAKLMACSLQVALGLPSWARAELCRLGPRSATFKSCVCADLHAASLPRTSAKNHFRVMDDTVSTKVPLDGKYVLRQRVSLYDPRRAPRSQPLGGALSFALPRQRVQLLGALTVTAETALSRKACRGVVDAIAPAQTGTPRTTSDQPTLR